jgi:hypothetical protein
LFDISKQEQFSHVFVSIQVFPNFIFGQQQTFNYSHTTPDTQCYINSFLLSKFARHRAI